MKNINFLLFSLTFLFGCNLSKHVPRATPIGDPVNAYSYGYQPIDPLPVSYGVDSGQDKIMMNSYAGKIPNKRLMESFPDETMRIAIGQLDQNGNVSFASSKYGYKGSSYIVILDYIKFDTKALPVVVTKDTLGQVTDFKRSELASYADAIIPVYIGVGLRFTANVTVNEGSVDLGNLFALGIAAETKKVTGTLVIQTLGISGKDISSLIPMPGQINTTTIQNAIMSLASIKAKIYEDESELTPRVVGFYNNIGGGQNTVQKFITNVLTMGMFHIIR